jgi:hypothetical protein
MNNFNFGLYIEDILTRIMNGDEDNLAMLPCYYVLSCKEEKKKSVHRRNLFQISVNLIFYRIHMDVTT